MANGSVLLWLWDDANTEWVKAPAVVVPLRLIAAGPVVGGAHKLYWVTMNPSAGLSVFELTDDTTGLTAVVYDHFHTAKEAHHVNLSPPMPFTTGIYLKTLTNMTSIIFGYI